MILPWIGKEIKAQNCEETKCQWFWFQNSHIYQQKPVSSWKWDFCCHFVWMVIWEAFIPNMSRNLNRCLKGPHRIMSTLTPMEMESVESQFLLGTLETIILTPWEEQRHCRISVGLLGHPLLLLVVFLSRSGRIKRSKRNPQISDFADATSTKKLHCWKQLKAIIESHLHF